MSRLEEIKNEYAQYDGRFLSWNNLMNVVGLKVLQQHENEVMQIYAKECSQASLEKASENAELCTIALENGEYKIDKESIINFENINIL